jgi:hypothetical protein
MYVPGARRGEEIVDGLLVPMLLDCPLVARIQAMMLNLIFLLSIADTA